MKKKVGLLILAAVVASAVVMLGMVAPAGSQQPAERQTITLFDARKTNFESVRDEGKRGISPGDRVLFVDNQFDPESCAVVGKLTGQLQIVKVPGPQNARFLGEFSIDLPGGKITAAGGARFSEFQGTEPVFAVTGGTGDYRDASGEVSFQEDVEMCDKKGSLTTIDLGPRP